MTSGKKLFLAAVATVGVAGALPSICGATVIIQDSFTTGPAGSGNWQTMTSTTNRTPDVTNLPGNYEEGVGTSSTAAYIYNANEGGGSNAHVGFNSGVAESLGTYSSTNLPPLLTISTLGLYPNFSGSGLTGSDQGDRGADLGFWSQSPGYGTSIEAGDYFAGFALDTSGNLKLITNGSTDTGAPDGELTYAQLKSAGALTGSSFNAAAKYPLSFTINTATGDVTDVVFNNVDVTSAFSPSVLNGSYANFESGDLNLAGFFGSSNTGSSYGLVYGWTLASAPEPSTALVTLIAGAVLVVRRRRA